MQDKHLSKDMVVTNPKMLAFISRKCRYVFEFVVFATLLYGIYHFGYASMGVDIDGNGDYQLASDQMKLAEDSKRKAQLSTTPPVSQALPAGYHQSSTISPRVTIHQEKILQGFTNTPFYKPQKLQTFNEMWQIVNDSKQEVYLYSAWYDDRPSLGGAKTVRIIAVADEKVPTLLCLFWYKGVRNPDLSLAMVIKSGATMPRHGVNLHSVVLSCDITAVRDQPPGHVSVVSGNVTHPSTLLPVQVPERPPFPYEFGQCVSVTYWKHDPYRIVEWMEMQQILGVQEVTIYNNSLVPEASRVFQHYARERFVDFRQMPSCIPDEGELTILLLMSAAINDCMYRNMYRYNWIVCTDVDEFIVPRIDLDYAGMLETVDKLQPHKLLPPSTYVFRNAYFFFDLKPVSEEPWFLKTLIYLKRIEVSQYGYASKSITDPMSCVALQNHVCWHRTPKHDRPGWFKPVDPAIAMSHHYKKCHFDEYLQKPGTCAKLMMTFYLDMTMFNFTDTLVDRVSERLFKLDLIGNDKHKLFDGFQEVMPEDAMDDYGSDYDAVGDNDDKEEPDEADYEEDGDMDKGSKKSETEKTNNVNTRGISTNKKVHIETGNASEDHNAKQKSNININKNNNIKHIEHENKQ